jgi:hypothetical protein
MTIDISMRSMDAPIESATLDIPLAGGWLPGVDLSAAAGAELRMPIVEAFTLPTVDLESVAQSVRAVLAPADREIDGVAVFENFDVDVVLSMAAYATIGNSGADGVWTYARQGRSYPRSPNLMQMNVISPSRATRSAAGTLLHEFGHRWLQFVETMENGARTIALNPSPAHPPQFASAPAAFPVINEYDTSAMGGGSFTQAGNTFTAAAYSPFGYSWLDLYLMGLAAPEEVPDLYVIDGANPPLGVAYHPPSNITVTGSRRDIKLQQVIDAMGPRVPSASASRRAFRIAFVLVFDASRSIDADLARLEQIRAEFADLFWRATGRRASVQTLFAPSYPRRRSVR